MPKIEGVDPNADELCTPKGDGELCAPKGDGEEVVPNPEPDAPNGEGVAEVVEPKGLLFVGVVPNGEEVKAEVDVLPKVVPNAGAF